MIKKGKYLFSILILITLGIISDLRDVGYSDGLHKNKTAMISLGGIELTIELALTPEEWSVGLMHREKLKQNGGMLFVFPQEVHLSFWMKNTSIPLSIAFIKADGRITQIESMKPYSLDVHSSKEKAKYALEMNKNWFKSHNIHEGDFMKIVQGLVVE